MVRANVVAAKLAELADRIQRVESHRKSDPDMLGRDRDALDLVAFNLMLAIQTCADLANHIIADEGWLPAKTLAQCFTRLCEHGVLEAPVADAVARAVGLRNVVAHGYAAVDPALVHSASWAGLSDLDAFARHVATWTSSRTGLPA